MTVRQNILALLNYEKPEYVPVLAFGYWNETLDKWVSEGHISVEDAESYKSFGDNSPGDRHIMDKLGFDWCWGTTVTPHRELYPYFSEDVLETRPDGSYVTRDAMGMLCVKKPDVTSIPTTVGTSLTGREAWEELFLPRLRYNDERIPWDKLNALPDPEDSEYPVGLWVASLMGSMRDMLGVEELSYLWADDEELYREIVDTICSLGYENVKRILATGKKFDFGHYWEDICFKNGPLVSPAVFREVCGPWYRKINDLLRAHGVPFSSLDCDGCIDALIPIWLDNGVNIMFPMEVGTWNASIVPWREKFGKELRGVGCINKLVFALDRDAVDAELRRLRPQIEAGGFVPCVDHRIAPDAKFELIQYFCDALHNMKI